LTTPPLSCKFGIKANENPAEPESQVFKQIGHRGVQSSGNNLQGYDSRFSLTQLNIRDMTTVHIETDSHVYLGPSFLPSQDLDSFSQSR
jgi:hypothetical protein